ncbi:MAG: hypothetical protein P1U86_04260 [Verrucomicrobiales bacterium]|nr:hypothetical protein [Verrucomicrobiales bacterium]
MKESFQNLAERIDDTVSQLIWDQWSAIGGSGSQQEAPVPFAVDIDALVLATTRFGRSDPRILEQAKDWLAMNGKLVNLQRLKNIQRSARIADEKALGALAEFMVGEKHHNWKTLLKTFPAHHDTVSETSSPWNPVRQLSRKPSPHAPECFLIRLRNFFGMNARAEIMLWMLTHREGHAARIARDISWLPKTVQVVLNELCMSDTIHLTPRSREVREKSYSICDENWRSLFPQAGPVFWVAQPPLYDGLRRLSALLELLQERESATDQIKGMTVRKHFKEIAIAFGDADFDPVFFQWDKYGSGEELLDYFTKGAGFILNLIRDRDFSRNYPFPLH